MRHHQLCGENGVAQIDTHHRVKVLGRDVGEALALVLRWQTTAKNHSHHAWSVAYGPRRRITQGGLHRDSSSAQADAFIERQLSLLDRPGAANFFRGQADRFEEEVER